MIGRKDGKKRRGREREMECGREERRKGGMKKGKRAEGNEAGKKTDRY